MKINDLVNIYKQHGNHRIVAELQQMFYSDNDLVEWRRYFEKVGGFAQDPWYVMWDIIVRELNIENFLDVGVHVGQFSILPVLLGKRCGKEFNVHMVSPFNGKGDKYSTYEQKDYGQVFLSALADMMISAGSFIIHHGLSQDENIKNEVKNVRFDLIYIDGSHDYEVVLQDIDFYVFELLKPGGIVIFDDAQFYIPAGGAAFQRQGYPDVVRAVSERMEGNETFEHLFDVAHNRIFRRKEVD